MGHQVKSILSGEGDTPGFKAVTGHDEDLVNSHWAKVDPWWAKPGREES